MGEKKAPLGKIRHELSQRYKNKICLHPKAKKGECEGQICRAHTISRSSTLKKIINDKNKVCSFFPMNPEKDKIHKKGWKKEATVFLGFCEEHDEQTFSDIEKTGFEGSDKECFLIGYRALCHEFYMKKAAVDSSDLLERYVRMYGDGVDLYFLNQNNKEFEEGLSNAEALKNIYDKALNQGEYEEFNYAKISFSGNLSVVSTGMMTPDFAPNGEKLQDYFEYFDQNLLFGIISTGGRNYFVFHWPSKFEKVTTFVESVLNHTKSRLPDFLVQFMFNYVENTYFSESWWENLSRNNKEFIKSLAYKAQAYGRPLEVENRKLVRWNNIKIERNYNYT